jgi:hypothetical protein
VVDANHSKTIEFD